jgi:hypothetical protein
VEKTGEGRSLLEDLLHFFHQHGPPPGLPPDTPFPAPVSSQLLPSPSPQVFVSLLGCAFWLRDLAHCTIGLESGHVLSVPHCGVPLRLSLFDPHLCAPAFPLPRTGLLGLCSCSARPSADLSAARANNGLRLVSAASRSDLDATAPSACFQFHFVRFLFEHLHPPPPHEPERIEISDRSSSLYSRLWRNELGLPPADASSESPQALWHWNDPVLSLLSSTLPQASSLRSPAPQPSPQQPVTSPLDSPLKRPLGSPSLAAPAPPEKRPRISPALPVQAPAAPVLASSSAHSVGEGDIESWLQSFTGAEPASSNPPGPSTADLPPSSSSLGRVPVSPPQSRAPPPPSPPLVILPPLPLPTPATARRESASVRLPPRPYRIPSPYAPIPLCAFLSFPVLSYHSLFLY